MVGLIIYFYILISVFLFLGQRERFLWYCNYNVRAIEPHNEADPAALLVEFLTAFGSVVGPGPYFCVEADEHRMRLFVTLVGETSKAAVFNR
jgi:hypothetical protein